METPRTQRRFRTPSHWRFVAWRGAGETAELRKDFLLYPNTIRHTMTEAMTPTESETIPAGSA